MSAEPTNCAPRDASLLVAPHPPFRPQTPASPRDFSGLLIKRVVEGGAPHQSELMGGEQGVWGSGETVRRAERGGKPPKKVGKSDTYKKQTELSQSVLRIVYFFTKSSAGIGGEYKKPCRKSQPSAIISLSISLVSIPSAVTV